MRPRLRHRDSSSSHRRILPMVVAAKTCSSFSRSHRLERAFFSDDGLQTTTLVFWGTPEHLDLRARLAVSQALEDAMGQIAPRERHFGRPSSRAMAGLLPDWLA